MSWQSLQLVESWLWGTQLKHEQEKIIASMILAATQQRICCNPTVQKHVPYTWYQVQRQICQDNINYLYH
jgi:hypothetical protein